MAPSREARLTAGALNRLQVTVLIAVVSLLVAGSANAANWYVRSGGAGSNTGADWNNAWDLYGIAWSSVSAGDTIWLAGGTYAGTFSTVKSGTYGNPVTFARVRYTNSVPASAAGWSPGFDSQVIIDGGANVGVYLANAPNYVTFDGQIPSGIKVAYGEGHQGIWYGDTVVSTGVILRYIEVQGPGVGITTESDGIAGNSYGGAVINTLISHCNVHDTDVTMMRQNWTGSIVEYCQFYNIWSGGPHPDAVYSGGPSGGCTNSIFRFNTISNNYGEAVFYTYGRSTGEYWYGNVFLCGYNSQAWEIRTTSDTTGLPYGTFYVWNNTFSQWGYYAVAVWGVISSSSTFYNNVFDQIAAPNIYGAGSGDYNYFTTGTTSDGGTHSLTGASPFVAEPPVPQASGIPLGSPGNVHLLPASGTINKGKTLTVDGYINMDMDGNTRGADGTWDIGAYEYPVSGPNTNAVIRVSPTTLPFGPVAAGASVTNTFTVQNAGFGTLSGTATVATASTNFLKILSGGTYTGANSLGAGQSQVVTVRYTPTGASTDNGSITCSGGGGAQVGMTGSLLAVLPGLSFPSYAGVITAPFATNSGYLSQTVDVSNVGQEGVTSGGQAVYTFNISTAGNYTISASVNAPNSSSKSFWVNMDALPTDPSMIWDIYPYTVGFETETVSWRGSGTSTNDQFAPAIFSLSAGMHQLIVVGREAGVQLGQITIATYNSARSSPPPSPPNVHILTNP
jgi:hypothetical protein